MGSKIGKIDQKERKIERSNKEKGEESEEFIKKQETKRDRKGGK